MKEALFVYGTLAPGRPNAHILKAIGGTFSPATVKGRLIQAGWGAASGYPAIVPDQNGQAVPGFVFESANLGGAWPQLDAFEGSGYRRVEAPAEMPDGTQKTVWLYALAEAAV